MIKPIVTDIEKLREKSFSVISTPYMVDKLIKDLAETMEANNGLGLSAIQIGVPLRVAVVRTGQGISPLINPKIVQVSERTTSEVEGCLSLPDTLVQVVRPMTIELRVMTRTGAGAAERLHIAGLLARVVQHELDHMDGKLIIDYLPSASSPPLHEGA